jgi:hypothetical protein
MDERRSDCRWKRTRGAITGIALVAGALTLAPHAQAEDWQFGGHLKAQYSYTDFRASDIAALVGDDPASDLSLDVRLKADKRDGPWDFSVHYEVLAVHGDALATRRALLALGLPLAGSVSGLPNDDRRLFNLTSELIDRNDTAAVQRLDRLSVGYGADGYLIRFGRQAVSWGNGLIFQPLDFINPFSPVTIDKDYKTGDDMLYGQWQYGGGDVQAMVVPRRDLLTHAVAGDESSYAAKWRTRVAGFDFDLLAARHYDENLLGAGLARSVGGAVWRLDVAVADLTGADPAWSLVTNIDYSWTLFGKNMYGFAEYFHNGVGEARAADYLNPSPALAARLARGELFTLARDYAALGLQVELAPLVNVFGNLIQNLNDGSRFFQLRGIYDWRQNTQLMAGFNQPAGERGSEYGGISVPTPLPGTIFAPGRSVYLRAAYYF